MLFPSKEFTTFGLPIGFITGIKSIIPSLTLFKSDLGRDLVFIV